MVYVVEDLLSFLSPLLSKLEEDLPTFVEDQEFMRYFPLHCPFFFGIHNPAFVDGKRKSRKY